MRKLTVALGLLALFLAACSSGGNGADERQNEANDGASGAVSTPASVAEPTTAPDVVADGTSGGGALSGLLNPLSFLAAPVLGGGGSTGLPAASDDADPTLKAALLTVDDLPAGYETLPPGEMSFAFDTDEGSMSMAMSMFALGGMLDAFPESMVISGAITGSGDLLGESFAELQEYADSGDLEQEIEDAMGAGDLFGIGISDVQVLDTSSLGDGGFGMHMVMTIDMEELGVPMPPEADFLSEGLSFDMYVFWRGEHVLMAMSMWPGAGPAPVDAAALAEVMDTRAEDAF